MLIVVFEQTNRIQSRQSSRCLLCLSSFVPFFRVFVIKRCKNRRCWVITTEENQENGGARQHIVRSQVTVSQPERVLIGVEGQIPQGCAFFQFSLPFFTKLILL